MKKLVIVSLLLAVTAGAAGLWFVHAAGNQRTIFHTVPIERGTLVATISATGTIEPEEVVDVGAQIVGQIKSFGHDLDNSSKPIDFGSRVEVGTELAQIDDALYAADVAQAEADLGQADANVTRARADLEAMRSKLVQTERDWNRVQRLGTPTISQLDFDLARNAYETAKAAVPGGEAAVLQAQKAVEKAKAVLDKAKKNLGYTVIKSPVKGVIVDRRVNIGQTVVSSLNAPSLFLIAKDLTRLQIWASVNEADIGHIRPGQQVHFSVDAYPGETFQGEVAQVRLNANMTQNVVTYTVVVNTNNQNGKLLPYLTANLQFLVDERHDVPQVPNAALRWRPQLQQVAPDARDAYAQSLRRQQAPGGGKAAPVKETHDRGTIWIKDGNFVRPVKVKIGLSDGINTEVSGKDVQEGMQVVVRESQQEDEGGTNPFTPKLFGNKKEQ